MVFNKAFRTSAPELAKRGWLVITFLALLVGGCDRQSLQLSELREENQRLKKALEQARSTGSAPQETDTGLSVKADLDLSIVELWSQRYEDNQFRSKQRLDQKQIRVTGTVESVFERSVTIFGTGTRIGSISVLAQLDEVYISQNAEGLASLQKGAQITVQGRFLYDKMWLQDAVIVDRQTGKRMLSKELLNLTAAPSPSAAPRGVAEPGGSEIKQSEE